MARIQHNRGRKTTIHDPNRQRLPLRQPLHSIQRPSLRGARLDLGLPRNTLPDSLVADGALVCEFLLQPVPP